MNKLSKNIRIKEIISEVEKYIENQDNLIFRQEILINALIKQNITLKNENISLKNENIGLCSRITNKERRKCKKKYKYKRNKHIKLIDYSKDFEDYSEIENSTEFNEISKSFPPNSNLINIDASDKISETKQIQNDGYNKKHMFSMFKPYINHTMLEDSAFNELEDKDGKFIKLKDVEIHKFILKRNNFKHILIASNSEYKRYIWMKNVMRLFTFIEYNEDYIRKHNKNYVFNCDQIASVLLPYIWEQIPFKNRLKMTNFIKIVVLHKLTNEGIGSEHRFLIIYEEKGKYKYYLVDDKIEFYTNVKFNFMEQNLYCGSLVTFDYTSIITIDEKTKRKNKKTTVNLTKIDNKIQEACETYFNKIEHSFKHDSNQEKFKCNNDEDVIKIVIGDPNDDKNDRQIEFNYKFNFNNKINSSNVYELFDYLRVYNRFNIIDNAMKRVLDNGVKRTLANRDYDRKIMEHFVKDFSKESLDKLNLKILKNIIEPDTVIVTLK